MRSADTLSESHSLKTDGIENRINNNPKVPPLRYIKVMILKLSEIRVEVKNDINVYISIYFRLNFCILSLQVFVDKEKKSYGFLTGRSFWPVGLSSLYKFN